MAYVNNLLECVKNGQVCAAPFLKLVSTPQSVLAAKAAGFNAVLIDLEHTTLSIADGATLCMVGLAAGVTPLVRLPYQCGDGYAQQVLDNGAMGIVFPHCNGVEAAKAAAAIAKYPPLGHRSIGAHFPQLNCATQDQDIMMPWIEHNASTVIVMCESVECLNEIDEVAAVPGVDGVMIGTFDLCASLGILNDWQNPKLKEAFSKVGMACKKNNKIFGVAGLNHLPEMLSWAISYLELRLVITRGDTAMISDGMKAAHNALKRIQKDCVS